MNGKIVVVEIALVVGSAVSSVGNLSLEFVFAGDGMVLRNDNATWHVISTELPNL